MKTLTFATRNFKEIVRDPLNLAFGLGFPIVLLLLFSVIQANLPVQLFEIQKIAPGLAVFGLSFITLFSATIISKDRGSSFLQRLYTTPLNSFNFILGYTLPILLLSIIQSIICYAVAILLGLDFTINLLYAILFIAPISLLYIAIGLLCGSLLTDKQVGGVCGALLTNLSAWLSGIWFDLELVGSTFKNIAYLLPFVHAVDLQKLVVAGNYAVIWEHLLWVVCYSIIILILAVLAFLRQTKKG